MLLQKHLEILSDLYVEPINEGIVCSFLILNEGSSCVKHTNSKQPGPSKNGRPANPQQKP